jgi:hypothetical protein
VNCIVHPALNQAGCEANNALYAEAVHRALCDMSFSGLAYVALFGAVLTVAYPLLFFAYAPNLPPPPPWPFTRLSWIAFRTNRGMEWYM